jgi:hypothetical protein
MAEGADAPRALELGELLAERFRLRAQLGAGAFGTVYSARDEEERRLVAVKRLNRVTGATIYRFKREFRAVSDQHHPNLVRLHELFSDGDDWFFSMELVDGVRLDEWVLGKRPNTEDLETMPDAPVSTPPSRVDVQPDLERLRPALAQLAAGIAALHALGVVHRDLKPANVLVTPEGRVVLLDFGLVADADPDAQKSTLGVVMGTPTYMAPEQGLGRVTTAAADWYAFGVILFELLHGRPPFVGTAHDALTAKLSPSTWQLPERDAAPEDLAQLARALLAPEPADRPGEKEVVAAVGAAAFAGAATAGHEVPFVGRARELRTLNEAFDAADGGSAVVVQVHGESGVGKSALLREFTDGLGPDVLVLSGRCFERESVPYKALDGLVDALTRYLSQLTVQEANLLVPRDAQALCRLFPVFSRLRLLAEQPSRQKSWTPHEERRRGFAALREVLGRIADRRPLVVTIDDLQWGDEDSIEPLVGLLAPPDPPPLLLVLAYRSEDTLRRPLLRALRERPLVAEEDTRDVVLAPLTDDEAVELAGRLLPKEQQHRAELVARESGGLPYFLPELVRAYGDRQSGEVATVSLEDVVRGRVAKLSQAAQKLLAVVAVAGRPLQRAHASRAASLESIADEAVDELVHEHFLRTAHASDSLLETYHDRVRESVVSALDSDERRELHAALASVLSEQDGMDPEILAVHYRLAGDLDRARPAAVAAAERATDAFAFERAIAHYRTAAEGASADERREINAKLADVLAYAGRNLDAAIAYLDALEGAPALKERELKRRATELTLRAGRVSEGIALARELLPEVGLTWHDTRGEVLRSVIKHKALLKLRGYRFTERTPGPDDDDELTRIDLCWTLGSAFAPIDILRSATYQTQHLRRALALGEPFRVARGFALEAILMAVESGKLHDKAVGIARRSAEIAARIDNPHAVGWSFLAEAIVDWMQGRFRRAGERINDALDIMRSRDPEGAWQLALTEIWFSVRNHLFLGDLVELERESARTMREAEDRGDLMTLISAQAACTAYVYLAHDRLDDAREICTSAQSEWTREDGWHFQHQEPLRSEISCDCYEGDGARALARIEEIWPALRASLMLRIETERVFSFWEFSTAALHAKNLREAQRWTKKLSQQTFPWARALAAAARAGVLGLRGHDDAPAAYARAAEQLDALEMKLFAAAARRRRGQLLGGSEGEEIVSNEDALFVAQGAKNPAAFARVLLG